MVRIQNRSADPPGSLSRSSSLSVAEDMYGLLVQLKERKINKDWCEVLKTSLGERKKELVDLEVEDLMASNGMRFGAFHEASGNGSRPRDSAVASGQ